MATISKEKLDDILEKEKDFVNNSIHSHELEKDTFEVSSLFYARDGDGIDFLVYETDTDIVLGEDGTLFFHAVSELSKKTVEDIARFCCLDTILQYDSEDPDSVIGCGLSVHYDKSDIDDMEKLDQYLYDFAESLKEFDALIRYAFRNKYRNENKKGVAT